VLLQLGIYIIFTHSSSTWAKIKEFSTILTAINKSAKIENPLMSARVRGLKELAATFHFALIASNLTDLHKD